MGLGDELEKLEQLRQRGALSEDEYARAKARLLDGGAAPSPTGGGTAAEAVNRFRRSRGDRWLGGICGGLARSTGIESWAWRLILVLLALFGGTGVLLYILLWIFVPDE